MSQAPRLETDRIADIAALRARASRWFSLAIPAQSFIALTAAAGGADWKPRAVTALAIAAIGTFAAVRGRGLTSLDRLTVAIAVAGLGVLVDPGAFALASLAALAAYCDRTSVVAAACVTAGFGAVVAPQAWLPHGGSALAAAAILVWLTGSLRSSFRRVEIRNRASERLRAATLAEIRQLEAQAYRDALTGCRNRTFFMDRLTTDLNRANERGDFRFAVLFFDLDDFKLVNDTYGHRTGDLLLIEFARRIEQAIRPQDMLARLGGDEFVVLVEDIGDIAEAQAVGARIAAGLNRPFELDNAELLVSASIGVADSVDAFDSAEAMLREADAAMYRVKRARSSISPSIVSAAKHRVAVLTRRSRPVFTDAPLLN